jgi:hypothetical protein
MPTPKPLPSIPESFNLLLQSETQVVAGRLDLVLGFQVGHGVCVDAVDGHHEVSLAELGLGRLAAWCDLIRRQKWGKYKKLVLRVGQSSGDSHPECPRSIL